MKNNKVVAVFFSIVLMAPVAIAVGAFVFDHLENFEGKANCFNLQEDEEGSEEADDNEGADKITFTIESNSQFKNSIFNRILTNFMLKNTFYLPGVPSPPPEFS